MNPLLAFSISLLIAVLSLWRLRCVIKSSRAVRHELTIPRMLVLGGFIILYSSALLLGVVFMIPYATMLLHGDDALVVSGPFEERVTVDFLVSLIDERFTHGLVRISISDYDPRLLIAKLTRPGTIGLYLGPSKEIVLDKTGAQHSTLLHEIGHHVWYDLMTDAQRDAFTALHESSEYFPTPYATTAATEDFSDSFMLYFEQPWSLDLNRTAIIDNVTATITGGCTGRSCLYNAPSTPILV